MSKTLSIYGLMFEIDAPYAEGATINAAEAKALNQMRAENIGNNVRKRIADLGTDRTVTSKDGKTSTVKDFSEEAQAAAAALVAEANANYGFSLVASGGGRRTVDPVEKEALKIARGQLSLMLKKAGKTAKDFSKEDLDAKLGKLAEMPAIVKLAQEAVKKAQKAADDISLDDL